MTCTGAQIPGTKALVQARHAAVYGALASQPETAWTEEELKRAIRHTATLREVRTSLRALVAQGRAEQVQRGNRGNVPTYRVVKEGASEE